MARARARARALSLELVQAAYAARPRYATGEQERGDDHTIYKLFQAGGAYVEYQIGDELAPEDKDDCWSQLTEKLYRGLGGLGAGRENLNAYCGWIWRIATNVHNDKYVRREKQATHHTAPTE